MKWSWRIGTLAGIGIYIHATFPLIVAWVVFSYARNWPEAMFWGLFTLAMFVCILLHELGHALTARRFGIATKDITLLPIGGLARLQRMPDDPIQELWVALAGPAVNVLIAALLLFWLLATNTLEPLRQFKEIANSFLNTLMWSNIFIVVFNLIPAFPMDGGRVLRALLATQFNYLRATQIAATLGQVIAFAFGFFGLMTHQPFLVVIAFFVWIGAQQESGATRMRSALWGIPVAQAMLTDFKTLASGDQLSRAAQMLLTGSQLDFPIMRDGRVIGILTRTDLLAALTERREATVDEVMRRDFEALDPREMLDTAFQKLQQGECPTIPVIRDGLLVGLITTDNLGEFLMIQAALGRRR